MDIVHHGLIGVIGLNFSSNFNYEISGTLFLIGSVLPDLDIFFMLFGKSFYLKNHQSLTHSLLLTPIYSFLITLLFTFFIAFSWINFIALLFGFLIHILLDYSNTYGTTLLYPLSKKRFSLDAIFFIDTFLLILTISFLILNNYFRHPS